TFATILPLQISPSTSSPQQKIRFYRFASGEKIPESLQATGTNTTKSFVTPMVTLAGVKNWQILAIWTRRKRAVENAKKP
ncbi:MAG: hypothetical protein SGI77_08965, partial [Pirellulaceae bacterium]|nr:hypothetical protein [Pirellulaceae bacterium]